MATKAVTSHGTLLKVGDGASPEVFATIAEVKDISGPGTTLSTEDATNHDSGGWREPVPTLLEGGEVTFDLNYYGGTTQTSSALRVSTGCPCALRSVKRSLPAALGVMPKRTPSATNSLI